MRGTARYPTPTMHGPHVEGGAVKESDRAALSRTPRIDSRVQRSPGLVVDGLRLIARHDALLEETVRELGAGATHRFQRERVQHELVRGSPIPVRSSRVRGRPSAALASSVPSGPAGGQSMRRRSPTTPASENNKSSKVRPRSTPMLVRPGLAGYRATIARGERLRVGEVLGLTVDRLDVEHRLVVVDRQMQRIGNKEACPRRRRGRRHERSGCRERWRSNCAGTSASNRRGLLFQGGRGALMRRDQFYTGVAADARRGRARRGSVRVPLPPALLREPRCSPRA